MIACLLMLVTAYCPCAKCTKGTGIDASGHKPVAGVTVAIPRRYPLGSTVIIEGRTYRGTDRYASHLSDRIDIYFSRHDDAVAFGKQHKRVTIITPKQKKHHGKNIP